MNQFQNNEQDFMVLQLPIVIRQANVNDVRLLEWHGQFKHYRRLFQRAYREQLTGYKHLLVAASNDYPIGRLFIQFRGRRTALADGIERGYLYSLHVMELLRGKGVGTRLILGAERILMARGYSIATIAVAQLNTGALNLYERLGYQVFGEDAGHWHYYDHRGRLREVHEPSYLLAKSLVSSGAKLG